MTVIAAFRDGVRRVLAAPAVWIGAWLGSLLFSLPLAIVLRGMIQGHLGASLAAESAARGVNWDWWQEFASQASGVGASFTPSVIGFAAVLDSLSTLLDNRGLLPVIGAAVAAWLFGWTFLSGGILDRYARNRRTYAAGFFQACGALAGRLLRLGLVAVIAYWLLFRFLHAWLFDGFLPWATREFTSERLTFLVRLLLYLVFGGLVAALNVLLDYARVRLVVEDRRSVVGALLAGERFIRRRPARVAALYLLNTCVFLALLLVYAFVAPGAGSAAIGMWIGLLVSQAFIAARLWVKLLFYASQVAYFQGELAHADYVAAPAPEWPESPAAEAIVRG